MQILTTKIFFFFFFFKKYLNRHLHQNNIFHFCIQESIDIGLNLFITRARVVNDLLLYNVHDYKGYRWSI